MVKQRQSAVDFNSSQMAETPQFWLMYVMMTMVATGGLMAVAQLNPMAVDFKVDKIPVNVLWLTLPALQFALSADRLVNGICRPFWGWVSDHTRRRGPRRCWCRGSALTAGKAFDFRADILLLIGGLLAVFAHFLAPTVLRMRLSKRLHDTLFTIGLLRDLPHRGARGLVAVPSPSSRCRRSAARGCSPSPSPSI